MNYEISLSEMNRLSSERLSRQLPVSLDEKKRQYLRLKEQSTVKKKKQ